MHLKFCGDVDTMHCNPLVSIIMPTYNSSGTLREAIDSVIAQNYQEWELLITDDCSNDDTVNIISYYMRLDNRIKLYRLLSNSGAGVARNKSITNSNGKYIAFLDADDIWLPDKLIHQVSFMEKSGCLFSFSSYQCFSASGNGKVIEAPKQVTYQKLLYGNVIGCLTAIFNAEVLGKRTMPLIRKRQDMGLWLSLLRDCQVAYSIPMVLAKYRTDTGMTKNKISSARFQWKFYRKVVNLGVAKTTWYFFWYALNGLIKHRV